MFPSGVDLKLKRPKAASLAKKDDACIPLTLVCVCVSVCVLMLASGCAPRVQCWVFSSVALH